MVASGLPSATLFLDLDNFKEVNDTLGHPVGDALLRQVAARLARCVRFPDIVARLGGDEFAILKGDIASSSDAAALAQRVLDETNAPYLVNGETIRVGISIGIALTPKDAVDPDQIFKNADIALYAAKAEGRGAYCFFETHMEKQLQTKQRMKLDLAVALARSEFELVYQPIIDLHANKVACFEALLRWHHPLHGAIQPSVFIPIAEESGLIVQIGEWVLERACAEAGKWPSDIIVAVNLSTAQFGESNLSEMVRGTLSRSGLPPERLELEITETVLLRDSDANLRTPKEISALGVRIALDDFGTGFSSLGYLQKFPFSRIKIDRSFISDIPNRRKSHAIVVAVTGLGRALDIRITAEGVETRQQLERVRNAQCDDAQGYFFSPPIAAGEIPNLLERLNTTQIFWGAPNRPRPVVPSHSELPRAHS